jgi:LuxR family maltose regulon positive regulatory protein
MPVNSQIIKTKLIIPNIRPNLVSRLRLIKQIEDGVQADYKLTLVAAPAGFGKTTAVSTWVQQNQRQVAWLSLEESDDETILFWSYFLAAIRTILPGFAESTFAALTGTPPTPIKSLLPALVNELSGLNVPLVLVLDDYHVIANQEIHESVSFLLEHQPRQFHLIIATRADPLLPIARLRAQQYLTEIRIQDLRFTYEESQAFFNMVMDLGLTNREIQLLETRTEGWGVGLLLAAQSLKGREDKHEFIRNFSGSQHYILEYLVEEVLNRQTEGVRNFLLQTSILDRLCDSLCRAVTGNDSAEVTIQQLSKDNLFVIPLDQDHVWYRYHHLFADLLVNFLQKESAQEDILQLHQRASRWYQENDDFEKAIKHALNGRDYKRAADLIEYNVQQVIAHGQVRTLLGWIGAIPEKIINSHPHLRFYHAWALSLGGQHRMAERILMDAKSTFASLPNSPEYLALRGEAAALLTGIITYYNDPPRIIREAQEALKYLPDDNLISRARVFIALGTAYAYSDEIQQATQNYQKARDIALKAGNPFLGAAAIEMLAGMQIYHQGGLRGAAQNLEQILELGRTKDGSYQPFTGTAHTLLAEVNIEWNNLDAAARLLETGVGLIQKGGIQYSLTHTNCTKARLKIALGEMESALEALRDAETASKSSPLMHILIHNYACQVKFALGMGDIETASRWAKADSTVMKYEIPKNLPNYLCEVQKIALAHVFLAQGEMEKALETLNDIYIQAETAGRMRHIVEICLLKAIALKELGRSEDAFAAFENCIALAEPEGYVRLFLEAGETIVDLLKMVRGRHEEYVSELLASFDGQKVKVESDAVHRPGGEELVESLTEREMEVLRLMCEGYSNQDIADEIIVSVNTVKKHTSNIYGKLGVRNRAQAVLRAHEIELI